MEIEFRGMQGFFFSPICSVFDSGAVGNLALSTVFVNLDRSYNLEDQMGPLNLVSQSMGGKLIGRGLYEIELLCICFSDSSRADIEIPGPSRCFNYHEW